MARRKGKHGQQVVVSEAVEEQPGETRIVRTVREWEPHAPERLMEIEAIIDSWGRRVEAAAPARRLDYDYIESQVDKITRRVKDSRKVVVQETVTEWVERPVAPAPKAYAPVSPVEVEDTVPARDDGLRARPKRRFRVLGFIGEKAPRAKKTGTSGKPGKASRPAAVEESAADYKPQCAALTEDGQQCRNSARGVSRYCASHKGYQPRTAKGLAKRIEGDSWDPKDKLTDRQSVARSDTRPVVRKAKDTPLKVRKVTKTNRRSAAAGRSARRQTAKSAARGKGRKKAAPARRKR